MRGGPAGRARAWLYALDRRMYRLGLRDPARLTLPRFLGIGAVKGATTWLHHNLKRHPGVYVPPEKEVHWFDTRHQMPLRWYASRFADAGARVPGEVCPTYLALPVGRIREVRDLLPDVRLLVLLRDPVERAWSQIVMDVERFAGRELASVGEDELVAMARSDDNLRHGDYAASLERWWGVLPRERMLIRSHEDVAADPWSVLLDCFRHIGVATDVDRGLFPADEPQHVIAGGRRPPASVAAALREIHAPRVVALRALLGDAVPASW